MIQDKIVLCASSKYEQKFYLNEEFKGLPEEIKKELKIMCVMFTEDVGGIITLEFDTEGTLNIVTEAYEEDLLYDDIGCELKIKQLRQEKKELFQSLELFFRTFYLEEL
jgi:hypothetical protein